MQDLHGGVHERDPLPDRGEVLRLGGDFLGLHGLQERDQCEDEFLERGQVDGGGRSHEVGQAAENDVVMFLSLSGVSPLSNSCRATLICLIHSNPSSANSWRTSS